MPGNLPQISLSRRVWISPLRLNVMYQIHRLRNLYPRLLLTIAGLLLATALTVNPDFLDGNWRVLCGLFILFVFPGLILQWILFHHDGRLGVEELPAAVVLSLAVWVLPSSLSILLHVDWYQVQNVFLLILWGAGIILAVRTGLHFAPVRPSGPDRVHDSLGYRDWWNSFAPVLILLVLVVLAGVLVYRGPRQNDDWVYLGSVQQLLGRTGLEAVVRCCDVRYGFRFALNDWIFLQALVSRWFDLDPISLERDILPTAVAPLSLIALYGWAKAFTQSKWAGLVTVIFQTGIYLTFAGFSGWTYGFIARSAQDKFFASFLILPIVLLFFWRFMREGKRADLIAYGLALIALACIHAIGLAQFVLITGGFAILNLMTRNRFPLVRWALTLIWVIPGAIAALVLRFMTDPSSFAVDASAGGLLQLASGRLVLFPPFYVAHPDLIAHPLILIAIATLPLMARGLKTNPRVQFLWASTFLPLAVLFNPVTAWLMGQAITPFQLWRLTWMLPSSLTLAYWIKESVPAQLGTSFSRGLKVKSFIAGAVILLGIALSNFYPRAALELLAQPHSLGPTVEATLRALPGYACKPSIFLVPRGWSDLLPAFSANTNPIAPGLGTPGNDIGALVDIFYNTPLFTDDLIAGLNLHPVDFVVLPRASPLNDQLHYLPAFYALRYANSGYVVYQTASPPTPTSLTHGNTALLQGDYLRALDFFQSAELEDPGNTLVYFGLAWAYNGLGELGHAEQSYGKALSLAPGNYTARLKLADFYQVLGRQLQARQQRARAETILSTAPPLATATNCSISEH